MEQYIAHNARLELFVTDLLAKRGDAARSGVWRLLPEDHPLAGAPQWLTDDFGLPEWVLPNIVGVRVHVSSSDPSDLSKAVAVTRMSPVGTLAERFNRFLPGVQKDGAGGLEIRRLGEDGVYYAARGRILIASLDRRSLVYALTLGEDEHQTRDTIETAFGAAGAEDVRGMVALEPTNAGGEVLASVGFALRFGVQDGELRFQAVVRPEWEARLAKLTARARPVPLLEPLDSPAMASINFGLTLDELWPALGEAFAQDFFSPVTWRGWTEAEEASTPSALTSLLGPAGPGFRLSWTGIDVNETVPFPEFALTVDSQTESFDAAAKALPAPPASPALTRPRAYYDSNAQRAYIPGMAGPSTESVVGSYGGVLLACSRRDYAESLWAAPASQSELPDPGNVYFSIRPGLCLDPIVEAGRLLAENDLLRGHTPESFEKTVKEWENKTAPVEELTALLAISDGFYEGSIRVTMSGAD
ncbi:MAG: hypothetical protein QGG73_02810 [Candidatus Hydrogenedentes bacterium]|jgi:hypothetical protein|nr:hypothetical protein [Candidatus Hydrogenedentota bacterium]